MGLWVYVMYVCIFFDLDPLTSSMPPLPIHPVQFYLTILRVQQPSRRLRKVFRLVSPWSCLRILLGNVFSYDHLYSRRSSVSHCLIVRLEYAVVKDSFKIVPSSGSSILAVFTVAHTPESFCM